MLEAIVQTIRSKKISTSSQKFLVCNAMCTVKDWIKSDKCKRFNLPAASLQSSFSSFTSATLITPLQDDALYTETDLEIVSTEIIPHMKNSQLSTSPPSSPIYPTTSSLLEEHEPSPIEELTKLCAFISNPRPSLSSSTPYEHAGDADDDAVRSVLQDICNPSSCKICSVCRKIAAELVMDPIKDCFLLGVAFSCMDYLPTSVLEGMSVCLDCYNKAVSFLMKYYKMNYKSKSLLVTAMKIFRGDFIWNSVLTQHMRSNSITKEIDLFLRRRLLIVGSISLNDAFIYLSDTVSCTTIPIRTLLVLFQTWSKHALDVIFVASSTAVRGHSDAINFNGGKLVNMGPQAADFNPACYSLQPIVEDTERCTVSICRNAFLSKDASIQGSTMKKGARSDACVYNTTILRQKICFRRRILRK